MNRNTLKKNQIYSNNKGEKIKYDSEENVNRK